MTSHLPVSNKRKIVSAIASALVFGAASQSVLSADAKQSAAQSLLEEVLVIGTKRGTAEEAQAVPGQVAAFGSDQLEVRQVINLEDLSFATPNVQLDGVGTLPGVANFTIRGIGINSSIPSIDPTVGTFVDGVYMGVTYGVITDTFDLEAVEIYKGPQGLLFGRNVTGGAVLLRSRRPSGEFGVRAKVGVETGPQYTGALAVEGALVEDVLAAKLALYHKDDEGFFDSDTLNAKVGEDKTQTQRLTLAYTPSDSTDITFIYERGEMEGHGGIAQSARGVSPAEPNEDFEVVIGNPGVSDSEWNQATLEAGFDIGGGRLTNILGYRDVEVFSITDIDGGAAARFDGIFNLDQQQFSNELRFNINPTESWELAVGAYYFEQDFFYFGSRSFAGGARQLRGGGDQEHSTWGLFLNNDIDLSEDFTLTMGLRYTEEEKDVIIWALGECDFDLETCPDRPRSGDDWSNVTPKLGFRWHLTDDAQLYAHWTRGFRSGGYNFRTPLAADPLATDEETQDSFEVGVKSVLADGKLRLNGAVFVNKIDDVQRETLVLDQDLGFRQDFVNSADVTIQGIEFDISALVTDNLAVIASAGYLDGEYDEVFTDLNGDMSIDEADRALDIPRLSEWTTNLAVTYDLAVGDFGSLSMRADYSYRSEAAYTDNNRGRFPDYSIVNAGLFFYPSEGNWSVSVYGKNLGDTAILGNVTPLPWPDSTYFAPLKKGRRFGIDVKYEF